MTAATASIPTLPLRVVLAEPALRTRARWLAAHVLPHEPALRSWLKRRMPGGLEADDIIQETYAVLSALASVDHVAAPRAYAFQVAWSLTRQHLRRAKIAPMLALDALEHDPEEPAPSPERQVSARDDLRRVAAVVARLPERCREAFLLRRSEGLSQREISVRMGISESTVEKHLARALRDLGDAFRIEGAARGDARPTGARTPAPRHDTPPVEAGRA